MSPQPDNPRSPDEAEPPHRWQAIAVCGLLLLAVGLIYGQTAAFQFVNLDDNICVTDNPHVTGGPSADDLSWAFTHCYAGCWVPLTWISHMFDWQLYGDWAGGHHLTNVLLHAATTLLLFLTLRRMTGRSWPSALAAALFAVHPLRVESVAWVTERKDVLSGLFFVLALWAYAGYARSRVRETHQNQRIRHTPCAVAGGTRSVPDTLIAGALRAPYGYLAVTAFFALGLMAKPSVVTLPFVLLLLDYWPLGRMQDRNTRGGLGTSVPSRVRGKRGSRGMDQDSGILFSQFRRVMLKHNLRPLRLLLLEKLPLLALAAVSCAVTVWAQGSALTANEKCSFGWRMRHIPVAYAGYLYQFFHPVGLAVPYPRPAELPPWQVLGSLAILVLVTAAAWAGRRRFPYLLVGWLWYLGMLLPAIGLVQFGVQATADRFTYLPQIGLGIALAWGLADLCRVPAAAFRRWALSAVAVLAVLALTACAWQQTTFWRDNQTLWTHALECTSNNVLAHVNLGNELTNQNQWADALLEYQRALKIDPRCAEALNNGGRATAALGRPGDAIPWYRKAIAADHTCAEAYWNLANLLAARGKPEDLEEAVERYGAAVRLRPEQADWQTGLAKAQNELGGALADAGRPAEAVRHYGAALQARPDFFDAHYNLGVALARLGQFGEAIGQLREALRLKPDDAEAHSSLGMALANTGRFGRAMAECQAALRIKPDSAATLGILAAIYAQAGRRSEALATFHKALELATRQKNQALANDLRAKLAALERQEPTGPSPPPPK